MGMEDFYTRDKANEGRRIELRAPDGSATDHWLQVRHVWSDAFQEAEEASLRHVQEQTLALGKDASPKALADLRRESTNRLLASLVCGWSFEAECTPENVADFLTQAPQIAERINRVAADAKGFFGKESPEGKPAASSGSKAKSD